MMLLGGPAAALDVGFEEEVLDSIRECQEDGVREVAKATGVPVDVVADVVDMVRRGCDLKITDSPELGRAFVGLALLAVRL